MKYASDVLLALWLTFVMPTWLIWMLLYRELVYLPVFKGNAISLALQFAAMYVPPLFFVAVRLAERRSTKVSVSNA